MYKKNSFSIEPQILIRNGAMIKTGAWIAYWWRHGKIKKAKKRKNQQAAIDQVKKWMGHLKLMRQPYYQHGDHLEKEDLAPYGM